MDAKERFHFRGNINVNNLLEIYNQNELDWDSFEFRQQTFVCFADTKTLPIIYDETFKFEEKKVSSTFPIFESEILSIQEQLKLILNQDGEIVSFMLVNLPSKKQVMPHVDWLPFASKFDRFHIPIITNDDCIFTVGDESKNLKVGELWEINNDKFIHSVYNGGETDRVHIIMDWKRKTPTESEG
jgi:hypothetical protein